MNRSFNIQLLPFLKSISLKRGAIFGSILISALLAFEVFNFGTTSFALQDVLGNLKFAGIQWSTMLAFAFCGIDFAGIARIFTPEQGRDEPAEVWYLFGAWLLAAAFIALLPCWAGHHGKGCSDLCSGYGLADPCADHWYFLSGWRTSLLACRCSQSVFKLSHTANL